MRMRLRVSEELLESPNWRLPPGYVEVERQSCTARDGTRGLVVEGRFDVKLLEYIEVSAEIRKFDDYLEWQWRCATGPIGEPIRMPYFAGGVIQPGSAVPEIIRAEQMMRPK